MKLVWLPRCQRLGPVEINVDHIVSIGSSLCGQNVLYDITLTDGSTYYCNEETMELVRKAMRG